MRYAICRPYIAYILLLLSLLFITTTLATTTTLQSDQQHPQHCTITTSLTPQCVQWLISKTLSLFIITGACLLKVPQINNLITAQTSNGLSLEAQYFDLYSYSASASYNMLIKAPITTYFENIIILVQVLVIIALVWKYNNTPYQQRLMVFVSMIGFILVVNLLPQQLWSILIITSSFSTMSSRVTQIVTNYKHGNTGVLSIITVFMQVFGTMIRVFTTLTEVGDVAILITFIMTFMLNSIVFIQIIYYWNVTTQLQAKNHHHVGTPVVNTTAYSNLSSNPTHTQHQYHQQPKQQYNKINDKKTNQHSTLFRYITYPFTPLAPPTPPHRSMVPDGNNIPQRIKMD